mgnify:CR=1 FL=1
MYLGESQGLMQFSTLDYLTTVNDKYLQTNALVEVLTIPTTLLGANTDEKIKVESLGIANAGEYSVEVQINYMDKQVVLKKTFSAF